MLFSWGNKPLKIRSTRHNVSVFKHHLNYYFVVFLGACSLERLPKCAVQCVPHSSALQHTALQYTSLQGIAPHCTVLLTAVHLGALEDAVVHLEVDGHRVLVLLPGVLDDRAGPVLTQLPPV